MEGRVHAAVLCLLLLCQSASVTLAGRRAARSHEPGQVGVRGIPVCPVGLPACGIHGCYTPLLSKCDANNGCMSVKILSQLSALVRFGSSAAETAGVCPIPFANTCGDHFCAMGEVCVNGICQSNGPVQFSAINIGTSPAAAKAACQAARHGSSHCAGDTSDMATVDCNAIGVASIKGVFCFQSQLFNCAVQPGGSATFTCRGIAGVAQAVTEVFNSTFSTAAAMAAEMAESLARQEQQQLQAASSSNAAVPTDGQVPVVLAGTSVGSNEPSEVRELAYMNPEESSSISHQSAWRAGANAALGTLSNAVRDKSQPLLQPIFQNLANLVNNASKNLFNVTAADGPGSEGLKPHLPGAHHSNFDLGPAPIRDAAGGLPLHTMSILLVTALSAGLLLIL